MLLVALVADGPSPSLDLCHFRASFREDFDNFSVSAWGLGPGRWIAHTPWAGDFGDAAFTDPQPGFPFTLVGGELRIEARKDFSGKWRSGLLASVNPQMQGYTQLYGYFEMKAKLPAGPGLWPAFWLVSAYPRGSREPVVEIDMLEHYGNAPGQFHTAIHVWDKTGAGKNQGEDHVNPVAPNSLYSVFHTYGADVEPERITYYLDRQVVWSVPTPPEHRQPLIILLDLAMGSGWPIDKTPNPSVMQVRYIHAYRRLPTGPCQDNGGE